jgi:hypothetical protein
VFLSFSFSVVCISLPATVAIALFVRVHTFLQQVDSLRNATAETGDLHDFYNISHNNRLSGPSGTCGGRAFRPFFRRKNFFSTENRKQLFFNALNFRGGGGG